MDDLRHFDDRGTQYLVPVRLVNDFLWSEGDLRRWALASIVIVDGVVRKNRYGLKGE